MRRYVGVLNQMSIVLGIMLTQISGLQLATPSTWRYVLLISAFLGVAQFLLSGAVVESPAWLSAQHREGEAEAALRRVWDVKAPAVQASEGEAVAWCWVFGSADMHA